MIGLILAIAAAFICYYLGRYNSRKNLMVGIVTDYSTKGDALALCEAVITSYSNKIKVIRIDNNVTPFSLSEGALSFLRCDKFPKGMVFVAVVDPGVGTSRQAIAVKTKNGQYFVGPNNGIFSYVFKNQVIESVYILDQKKVNPYWRQGTFDGYDLFSPAAGLIATGVNLKNIAIKADENILRKINTVEVKISQNSIESRILKIDEPFGNIWTMISNHDLEKINVREGSKIEVKINNVSIGILPYVLSFSGAAEGEFLSYESSLGCLAIAVNCGDARNKANAKLDDSLTITKA